MKVRIGFVSNSSSSGFIVGFEKGKLPKSVEKIQDLLFGNDKQISIYDKTIQTDQAAKTVWDDLQKAKPMTDAEIANELEHFGGWDCTGKVSFPKEIKYDDFKKPKKDGGWEYCDWDQYEIEVKKRGMNCMLMFRKQYPNFDFFHFEYGDEDGDYFCVMEHGGIFDNVLHLKISHH